MGLANGVFQKVHSSSKISVYRFSEPHLAPLVLFDNDTKESGNGIMYTHYVNNGISLLRKYCTAKDRVLTMDMVNPFPYAMKWRPPDGGIAAIAFNYTLSQRYRPSFDAYFGNATVVLVPKYPAQSPQFIDGFYKLYKPELFKRFKLYKESCWFWLYKRNERSTI